MTGEQFKFEFPTPLPSLDLLLAGPQSQSSLTILRRWDEWPKPYVGLTGPERSGVTTVLKAWCRESQGRYLTPSDWEYADAQALAELLVCPLALDDCHELKTPSSLLTLMNLAMEKGICLLLGGHGQPGDWHSKPPDLTSRLMAMTSVVLPWLDDETFRARLKSVCAKRLIRIPDETLGFLEPRLERSYWAIEAFVQRLDQAMSDTGRPPTIPLARDIVNTLTEAQDSSED